MIYLPIVQNSDWGEKQRAPGGSRDWGMHMMGVVLAEKASEYKLWGYFDIFVQYVIVVI